jgi:hypothetical protein
MMGYFCASLIPLLKNTSPPTKNPVYRSYEKHQEKEIEKKIMKYAGDRDKMKQLAGYEWILEQRASVF